MTDLRPPALLDSLVSLCVSLLVAALLLFIAVRLIEAVWLPLVIITSAGLLVTGLAIVARAVQRRQRGW